MFLTYQLQIDRMYRVIQSGRTDASFIQQLVKPNVEIIRRKRGRQLEKDCELGCCVVDNKIILIDLRKPDRMHQSFAPAWTNARPKQ